MAGCRFLIVEGLMAALLEAITVKRKMYFEFENAPYYCLDAEVSTPTARGGRRWCAEDAEPADTGGLRQDVQGTGEVQGAGPGDGGGEHLYSDGEGSYFLDQETFDTLRLTAA